MIMVMTIAIPALAAIAIGIRITIVPLGDNHNAFRAIVPADIAIPVAIPVAVAVVAEFNLYLGKNNRPIHPIGRKDGRKDLRGGKRIGCRRGRVRGARQEKNGDRGWLQISLHHDFLQVPDFSNTRKLPAAQADGELQAQVRGLQERPAQEPSSGEQHLAGTASQEITRGTANGCRQALHPSTC
jgi:hypothetical protein